jgi:hypothetical protein
MVFRDWSAARSNRCTEHEEEEWLHAVMVGPPLPASLYSIARHDSADSFNISCAHSRTASLTAFCPLRTYGSPRSSRYVERRRHMCAKGHLQEQDDGATLST